MVQTLVLAAVVLAAAAGCATDKRATRIAFLSDTHVTLQTNESGALAARHWNDAITAVNRAGVDLVLIAGDLTESGTAEQFELFKRQARQFRAPVLAVPGNHDVGMAARGDVKATITSQREQLFVSEIGPAWFAQDRSGVRVVGINSCLLGTGLPEEDEQWKFLEQEFSRPRSRPALVLEHYPLFLKTADEPVNGTWNVPPEPRRRLLPLLQQAQVRAVCTGHLHYPITNRLDRILFLGNTAVAFGLPKGKQATGWMLVTVPRDGEVQFEFRRLE